MWDTTFSPLPPTGRGIVAFIRGGRISIKPWFTGLDEIIRREIICGLCGFEAFNGTWEPRAHSSILSVTRRQEVPRPPLIFPLFSFPLNFSSKTFNLKFNLQLKNSCFGLVLLPRRKNLRNCHPKRHFVTKVLFYRSVLCK